MIKTIHTAKAPQAIGPYSQAKLAGPFVFVSGQIALNPKTGKFLHGTTVQQTEIILKNVQAILAAAGSDLRHVLKTTVFLTDLKDFQAMNEIYAKYFPTKPARSTVEVSRLPKDAKVEIDVIALKRS